jgi:hypothetical protein
MRSPSGRYEQWTGICQSGGAVVSPSSIPLGIVIDTKPPDRRRELLGNQRRSPARLASVSGGIVTCAG